MGIVGNPNRRQFAGAEQGSQGRSVAAIGLDVIARPRWNQGGRNYNTFVSEHGELPMQTIAARPCFIAKHKLAALGGEAFDQFRYRFWPARNFSEKAHLAAPTAFSNRDRNRVLVRIIATNVVVE